MHGILERGAGRPPQIIHVSGSEYGQGQQHAEQLGAAVRMGMVSFYSRLVHRLVESTDLGWVRKASFTFAKRFLEPVIVRRLLKQVPASIQERIRGMAFAAELDEDDLFFALVLPDLLPWVGAKLKGWYPQHFVDAGTSVRFGCSSFIQSGDRFLIGRNLDFPGVGYWDRFPVVQCTTPSSGMKYLSFTTAGVCVGGITGINESQVYIGLHQHFCGRSSLKGTLPFILAEKALAQASDLEEAIEVLTSQSVGNGWAFLVADGKKGTAALLERAPGCSGLVRLEGGSARITHTNFFQTPSCRREEYAMSARMNWDNRARKERLETLLEGRGSALSPESACAILSDHYDPYWGEEKIANRVVSQSVNIQSLVLDPRNMEAWLAFGDAPIHLRGFQKLDLGRIFAGATSFPSEQIPGFRFQDVSMANAKIAYVEALRHAMDGNSEASRCALEVSLKASFSSEAAQVLAVGYLQSHRYPEAYELLQTAAEWVEKRCYSKGKGLPPEYFELRLFAGRAKDLMGDRRAAEAHYDFLSENPALEDLNLRTMARARRVYRKADLRKLVVPFSSYTPFF
jgi:hypothetical protein